MAGANIKRLFDCIEAGDVEGVRSVLASGVSAESRIRHRIPLHEAVSIGCDLRTDRRAAYFEIAELLVRAGADVNGATREPRLGCLQLAIRDLEWVEWLLARGANPDLYDSSDRDHDCLPPLMLAVRDGAAPQIERLIAAGARTDLVCDNARRSRQTLLGAAVSFQSVDILRVLLGAARFSTEQVNEALRDAIKDRRYEAITVLCGEGGRGDYQNREGGPTAWLAYLHRDRKAIELVRPYTPAAMMASFDAWSRRAVLGILAYAPEEVAAWGPNVGSPSGVVVRTVLDESAATRLALAPRDIITRIDDHPVESMEQLQGVLATYQAGTVVRVTYVRGGVAAVATGPLQAALVIGPDS